MLRATIDTEFDFDELGTSLIFDLVDLQFDIRELEASDCTTEESSGSWYILFNWDPQ
jgi:hypothetical protein